MNKILHFTRLNLLKKKGFDFSNSSFLTLTISDASLSSTVNLNKAKTRLFNYLKRNYNLRYYISVSEFQKNGNIHYHLILFNVPYIPAKEISKHWGLGFIKINNIKNSVPDGAFYYLLSYITKKGQKHLRLVWSKSFNKDGWFSYASTSCVYYSKKRNQYIINYPFTLELYLPSFIRERQKFDIDLYQLLNSIVMYYENKIILKEKEYIHYISLLLRISKNFY